MVAARSNLRFDGLHSSSTRPWTPGKSALSASSAAVNFWSRTLSLRSALASISCTTGNTITAETRSALAAAFPRGGQGADLARDLAALLVELLLALPASTATGDSHQKGELG